MQSRNDTAGLFGFSFQANAGIIIMLKNIERLDSIRLEGAAEDIELKLSDGLVICAQAKAVEQPYTNFQNVKSKFYQAIKSLSGASKKYGKAIEKLIYVTNSPDPLHGEGLKPLIDNDTYLGFNDLPVGTQGFILKKIEEKGRDIPPEKLHIYVIPFATDDLQQRFKYVREAVNDFVGSLISNAPLAFGAKLMKRWQNDLFNSGTIKDTSVSYKKKEIIWPLINLRTEPDYSGEFYSQFDEAVLEEVKEIYDEVMSSFCNRWEYVNKILFAYCSFNMKGSPRERMQAFIEKEWTHYTQEFADLESNTEVLNALTKIVLYNVLLRRIVIDEIKKKIKL